MNTARTGATLTPTHLDVLYLLLIGARRPAIADEQRLSLRTVGKRMAEIMQITGAPDPFGLGVIAIRRRFVAPSYVVAQAALRRPGPDWVTPTTRQYELLRLRAAGVPVIEVASKFGMSAITVQRHLHRLGADNGARTSTNSGALFEALQWV